MNRMKNFNVVYKIKKEKNCKKRCGGLSANGVCFNKNKSFFLNFYLAANMCSHYKGLTLKD